MLNKKNKYRLFVLFLLIISLFVNYSVFVLAAKDKIKQDLEKFTKKEYDLIFESELSGINSEYSDIFNISKKIDIFENLTNKAKSDRLNVEGNLTQVVSRIKSLEETIKILDDDISESMKKIADANINILETRKKIEKNSNIMKELKEKIAKNREVLLEYLDYLYKKGNISYTSGEIDNIKSILLGNEDMSELLNDLYFNSIIQIAGKKLIDKHQKYVLELYLKKIDLEKEKNNLSTYRKQLIISQKDLYDKKKFKEILLEASKGKQKYYKDYLNKKLEIENNIRSLAIKEKIKYDTMKDKILEKYGCSFIDVSKNTSEVRALSYNSPKCYKINKMIYSESILNKKSKLNIKVENIGTLMSWPIIPYRGISAYFHDSGYEKEFGVKHNAIDIISSQGTSIKAPMDGYVIFIKKPDNPDYSFMAIKHFDGYITVYGHLSEILVEEYDYIKKGQIFAKTGGDFGTNGAGYITTGPHLHFEVFKNEKYTDPLNFLDTSYLNYKTLPAKYKLKYFFDFKSRKGYEYKDLAKKTRTFKLKGNTETDRQKYLLNNYAIGPFSDWNLWVKEGVNGNIDPSLLMCIGLAESGLGRNLTTSFNVGNVGNNDRGDKIMYKNAKEGISVIVYTLNNKYFRGVNRLDKLSGAGRNLSGLPPCKESGEFCYASDLKHWHLNVATCLSHLKGYVVPNDYNFRITE